MKKILKKEVLIQLITFLIGVILSGGIVYATINATQVSYTTDKFVILLLFCN